LVATKVYSGTGADIVMESITQSPSMSVMGMLVRRDRTSMIARRAHPWSWIREHRFSGTRLWHNPPLQVVDVRPHGSFS